MTNWSEVWDGYPDNMLIQTEVEIWLPEQGRGEVWTVYMASRNEWKGRIKRVVSTHTGYSEDSFMVMNWEVVDDE